MRPHSHRSAELQLCANLINMTAQTWISDATWILSSYPVGISENSPAFQRRDGNGRGFSPGGTVETDCVSRPFGTNIFRTLNPALKRRTIIVCPPLCTNLTNMSAQSWSSAFL